MHKKIKSYLPALKNTLFGLMMSYLFISQGHAEPPPCYQKIERSFLNPYYITQAISLNRNIFQSSWLPITEEIKKNARNLPALVRQRAEQMKPNPFGTPFLPKQAGLVFEQVIIEILATSLAIFNIGSPNDVMIVFNYLLEQQKTEWAACFGEKKDK